MSEAREIRREAALAARAGPLQRDAEEWANALSHGVGFLLALVAAPVLIVHAVAVGDAAFVAGVSVFTATTIFLYLASTLYHAFPPGPAKRVFWVLDHAGIYLLIAGTYTPFTLGVLGGPRGCLLFGLVWSFAGAGVLLRAFGRNIPEWVSTSLYLGLGWIVLIALDLVIERVAPEGLAWLVAGGLAYTFGIVFFALDRRMPYGHFVWHLFVLLGTSCHAVAVYGWGT
ncbi:MAG: hemolysin III family protein [Pseudomonadales bacterium]|jgi:hemolysin III|nr:hemolysin III family protein [Pseudomonadales bacterium]